MLAMTPPMGWNSWNTFGPDVHEKLIMETADAMIGLGLDRCGYKYVVIDDHWSMKDRDPETNRLVPDPEKFPNGMKYVADYIHSKGLKLGIYSCAGLRTCGGLPGSQDHEFLDARTFADFGVDFLKYDYCNKTKTINGPLLYRRMGLALRECGRDIMFSVCNWGTDDVFKWARSAGAHLYRSTGDISDSFESIKNITMSQHENFCYSAPNCFNDMDMLTVGMYGKGLVGTESHSDKEYRTQFSLWCLFGAPLMLGCDIRSISDETLKLITNPTLLRINQDPEVRPAYKMPPLRSWIPDVPVFFRHLDNNEYAIGMFNMSSEETEVPVSFSEFGLSNESGCGFELTDAFTGQNIGLFREYYTELIASHSCRVYTAKVRKF